MNPYAQLLSAIGGLPDSYLVVDVETNGLAVDDELVLPTQLGYLLVVDRKVEANGAVVVNWSRILPRELRGRFWDKVRKTEQGMYAAGRTCKVTEELIRAEGEDPQAAWPAYHEMLSSAMKAGLKVAGHNIYKFDCPLLARVGDQMDSPLEFPADRLIDSGVFEKAIADGLQLPCPASWPLEDWYHYARYAHSRSKWSLAYCAYKYGLDVDMSKAHGADHDAYVVHRLIETHRALAEGRWQDSPPAVPVQAQPAS